MFPGYPHLIVITIEARMRSTRLPGKVLLPLAGKPVLQCLVERVRQSAYADHVVIATTEHPADDAIEALGKQMGVGVFRGSDEDVLGRVLNAAQSVKAGLIVELTGDCPLIDDTLVDLGIEAFFEQDVEYASNILKPTFPLGFAVQVFPTVVLAKVDTATQDPIDRTHVSYYIYQHPKKFRLHNWEAQGEWYWPELRLTLDEQEDYELLDIIFSELGQDGLFPAREVIAFLKTRQDLVALNAAIRQKHASEG